MKFSLLTLFLCASSLASAADLGVVQERRVVHQRGMIAAMPPPAAVACKIQSGTLPFNNVNIHQLGDGVIGVNGVVYEGYRVSLSRTWTEGVLFARVWRDDGNLFNSTWAEMLCQDPLPATPTVRSHYSW